jgi:hypothetical protein
MSNEINILINDTNQPVLKKRGRKPKIINTNSIESIEIKQIENILKKRGRKPNTKLKIIDLNKESFKDNIITNLIVHLPLKNSDINDIINKNENEDIKLVKQTFVDFTEDKNEDLITINNNNHQCYQCYKCLSYENKINKLEEEICNLKKGIMNNIINIGKKIHKLKIDFNNKLTNEWDNNTNIACWWCCHSFDNMPLGIPEFIYKDKFYLFGCFCSFNCIMAYNLDLNDYKIWDRQANIYQMKNKIDIDNKYTIQPAPPRQTLKIFGGPLNIEQYRESFYVINKEFRYFLPPMISIVGIIEEYNRDLSDKCKINRVTEYNFIKRNKPLVNKSTKLTDFIKN